MSVCGNIWWSVDELCVFSTVYETANIEISSNPSQALERSWYAYHISFFLGTIINGFLFSSATETNLQPCTLTQNWNSWLLTVSWLRFLVLICAQRHTQVVENAALDGMYVSFAYYRIVCVGHKQSHPPCCAVLIILPGPEGLALNALYIQLSIITLYLLCILISLVLFSLILFLLCYLNPPLNFALSVYYVSLLFLQTQWSHPYFILLLPPCLPLFFLSPLYEETTNLCCLFRAQSQTNYLL